MALLDLGRLSDATTGFSKLSVANQVVTLLALAGAVTVGVYVAFWAQKPDMVPLYAHLESAEAHKVMEMLQQSGISHKYQPGEGVMVPARDVHQVRMQLAAQGLPKGAGFGYELLDKPAGFGTSQFMETVRYRRSLEGELSKTITSLDAVRNARVHLGLPRQSSFLKRNMASSASVMLDLYGGQHLSNGQVMGIVHLVSSSVAGLKQDNVTVVDQRGQLLTSEGNASNVAMAMQELNYSKQKEQEISRKIVELLTPIYGPNSVRAEVTGEFDLTHTEVTREDFDQSKPNVRSEALITEQKTTDSVPAGIPGALSNQPPSLATAPEAVGEEAAVDADGNPIEAEPKPQPLNYRNQKTRNYELNKKITHEQKSMGSIVKLSVAVVINDKVSYDGSGQESRTPLTDDELRQVDKLVKDAIGYNEARGDSVSVINSSFATPPPIDTAPNPLADPMQLIQQPWLQMLVKQVIGGLVILILIFGVIRPMIRVLGESQEVTEVKTETQEEKEEVQVPAIEFKAPDLTSQARIEHVKQIAHGDSRKAAQVVMNWVGEEDE